MRLEFQLRPEASSGIRSFAEKWWQPWKNCAWLVLTHSPHPRLPAAISPKISSVGMECGGLGRSWAFASERVRGGRSKGLSGAIYSPGLQSEWEKPPPSSLLPLSTTCYSLLSIRSVRRV